MQNTIALIYYRRLIYANDITREQGLYISFKKPKRIGDAPENVAFIYHTSQCNKGVKHTGVFGADPT